MRVVSIPVYKFSELSSEIQNKVYDKYLESLENYIGEREDVTKAYEKAEESHTPWFFKSFLDEINGENIKKEIEDHFEFYENGNIFYKNTTSADEIHTAFDLTINNGEIAFNSFLIQKCQPNVNIEDAIRNACVEFMSTDNGKEMFSDITMLNINDFILHVPDDICLKYGFKKLNDDIPKINFSHIFNFNQ